MRSLPATGFTLCFLASTLSPAWSQTTVDPTRLAEGVRPLAMPRLLAQDSPAGQALEDENNFAPQSPGDDDIGQQLILKDSERQRWLTAQLSSAVFWSNNPANLSSGAESDVFSATQLSLGAQPRLNDRLYLDAFISQQWFRYDEFNFLDYEYLQASLGLIYLEPRLWDSVIFAQGQFARTTADNFDDEVLNSFSILAGIQKTVLFDRRNSLYMNLMGDWDVDTNVDALDHSEYIADLSYRFKIMRDLVVSASYRFTWFDYHQVDRSDALNIMGVFLSWSPEKWISAYAGCTFNFNNSNIDVFDYDAANLGGGLGIQLRF